MDFAEAFHLNPTRKGCECIRHQIKILWDDQTMRYLNFETTYYLQGDLLKRLQEIL